MAGWNYSPLERTAPCGTSGKLLSIMVGPIGTPTVRLEEGLAVLQQLPQALLVAWNSLSSGRMVLCGISGKPLPIMAGQIGIPTVMPVLALPFRYRESTIPHIIL